MHTEWSSVYYVGTEPNFRAWAGGVSRAMRDIGMVRVAAARAARGATDSLTDFNWDLVISVGTTGAAYSVSNNETAWEVWSFPTANAAQIAAPVFVRLGYGGNTGNGYPLLTIKLSRTAGTAGVTTGIGQTDTTSGAVQLNPANGSASTANSWGASDGNGFVLALQFDGFVISGGSQTFRQVIAVDRLRNPDGTVVDDLGHAIALVHFRESSTTTTMQVFDLLTDEAISNSWSYAPCVTQGGLSTTVSNLNANNETQVYPWWFATKNAHGVLKMICTYAVLDLPMLATQQVTWLPSIGGSPATRTIRALGNFLGGSPRLDLYGSPGAAPAIWWSDP